MLPLRSKTANSPENGMNIGSVSVAYHENRLITPHLKHLAIRDKLVLSSTKPWQGEHIPGDRTEALAANAGATVLAYDWPTEEEQRNAGQEWFHDKDWIWILDPDEFLTQDDQYKLKEFLKTAPLDAYVCEMQYTYWKSGYRIDPPEPYRQLIAARPHVRFVDKRVVNTAWGHAPVTIHHMSWAKTDREVWNKISHYAHAKDFDIKSWYDNIWKQWTPEMEYLHPTTPPDLMRAIPTKLPDELERLNLWPTT